MSVTEALAALAPYIIVAALAILIGAALGYYTAARDMRDEKARVWDKAYGLGLLDERTLGPRRGLGVERKNPYRKDDR